MRFWCLALSALAGLAVWGCEKDAAIHVKASTSSSGAIPGCSSHYASDCWRIPGISNIILSQDGKTVWVSSNNWYVTSLDAATGKTKSYNMVSNWIENVYYPPVLADLGKDGILGCTAYWCGQHLEGDVIDRNTGLVGKIVSSGSYTSRAIIKSEEEVGVFDMLGRSKEPIARLPTSKAKISPDGRYVAYVEPTLSVVIRTLPDKELVYRTKGNVGDFVFSQHGGFLASVHGTDVQVYDFASDGLVETFTLVEPATGIWFHDDFTLAAQTSDELTLYEPDGAETSLGEPAEHVLILSDKVIVDGKVVERTTGEPLHQIHWATDVRLSADKLVVSDNSNGTAFFSSVSGSMTSEKTCAERFELSADGRLGVRANWPTIDAYILCDTRTGQRSKVVPSSSECLIGPAWNFPKWLDQNRFVYTSKIGRICAVDTRDLSVSVMSGLHRGDLQRSRGKWIVSQSVNDVYVRHDNQELEFHTDQLLVGTFLAGDHAVVVGDNRVHVIYVDSQKKLARNWFDLSFEVIPGSVSSSAAAEVIAVGGLGRVEVYSLEGKPLWSTTDIVGIVETTWIDEASCRLAAGTDTGHVRVWQLPSSACHSK